MMSTDVKSKVVGECTEEMTINRRAYPHVYQRVLKYLCADVVLGQDF